MRFLRFLFLVLVSQLMVSCMEIPDAPQGFEELRKKEPISESFNVNYLFTEKGKLRARMKAPHIYDMFDADTKETVTHFDRSVLIEFIDTAGQTETKLTANRAVMYDKRGYAEATGNVVVVNRKGERMETEKLKWWKHQERLTTNSFVKIITPDEVLTGDSLTANTKFSDYRIYKLAGKFKVSE